MTPLRRGHLRRPPAATIAACDIGSIVVLMTVLQGDERA